MHSFESSRFAAIAVVVLTVWSSQSLQIAYANERQVDSATKLDSESDSVIQLMSNLASPEMNRPDARSARVVAQGVTLGSLASRNRLQKKERGRDRGANVQKIVIIGERKSRLEIPTERLVSAIQIAKASFPLKSLPESSDPTPKGRLGIDHERLNIAHAPTNLKPIVKDETLEPIDFIGLLSTDRDHLAEQAGSADGRQEMFCYKNVNFLDAAVPKTTLLNAQMLWENPFRPIVEIKVAFTRISNHGAVETHSNLAALESLESLHGRDTNIIATQHPPLDSTLETSVPTFVSFERRTPENLGRLSQELLWESPIALVFTGALGSIMLASIFFWAISANGRFD